MGIEGLPITKGFATLQALNNGLPKAAPSVASSLGPTVEKASAPGAADWGVKAGALKGQDRVEAQELLTTLDGAFGPIREVQRALAAAGPNSPAATSRSHAQYLLGDRPTVPTQAKVYDDALALMQTISARQLNPARLGALSAQCEEFAKKPFDSLELGRRTKKDIADHFNPATAAEVGTLLALAEKAKAGGNSRVAAAIAAFVPQVAKPEVTDSDRLLALSAADLPSVMLLSQATATQFLPADAAATTAAMLELFPPPPPGAGPDVKKMYADGAALVQELISANRQQFADAYARGDTALQQNASFAVNPRQLEKYAAFIEQARNTGLVELELTLAGLEKPLFPGLGFATPAEAKAFAPALARIRGANKHLTGDNASGEQRISAGIDLMLGPRPSDSAKAKLYDSVKPILAKQFGLLRGKPSLDALSGAVAMTGLPTAAIGLREQAVLNSGDKKEFLALVNTVNAAAKAGDTRFAQGLAMAGVTAFPFALSSNDPQMTEGAERLAAVWNLEPVIQKGLEPLLAKFTSALPAFDRIDAEQTKVLTALEKKVDAEYSKARREGRAPDREVLKALSAEAIATQQQFLVKNDRHFGEVFTAVERDQLVGVAQLFGEALTATAKDAKQATAYHDDFAKLYGPKFAKFFDQFDVEQQRTRQIAGTIERIRRKADVASVAPAAGPKPVAAKPSAKLYDLAKTAAVSAEDVNGIFERMLRMPPAQLDQAAQKLPEDTSPRTALVRAMLDEAKQARAKP